MKPEQKSKIRCEDLTQSKLSKDHEVRIAAIDHLRNDRNLYQFVELTQRQFKCTFLKSSREHEILPKTASSAGC